MSKRVCLPNQVEFEFPPGHGGRRKGAGRKASGSVGVAHRSRGKVTAATPVLVTMKLRAGLPSLRQKMEAGVVVGAFVSGWCEGFQVVEFSVQTDHLHLIVEASDEGELSRGMKGIAVRVARGLNRVWGREGRVWKERYHSRVLVWPREVRNALRYCLGNARKHGEWVQKDRPDPLSSGPWFDGWANASGLPRDVLAPVRSARSWLLRRGWRNNGLLPVASAPARSSPQNDSASPCCRHRRRLRRYHLAVPTETATVAAAWRGRHSLLDPEPDPEVRHPSLARDAVLALE